MAEVLDSKTDQVYGAVDPRTDREEHTKHCEPCEADNNVHPAVGWCETCNEMLCNDCYKVHCIPTLMRNHQLRSLEQMGNRSKTRSITNKCQKHEGKKLKYFCQDHRELGCGQCFVINHRQCNKVVCISEIATAKSDDLRALESLLSELDKRLKSITDKTEMNVSITGRQHDEAIAGIREAGDKMKKFIDALVKDQITKANQAKEDNMRYTDESKQMTEDIANRIGAARDVIAAEYGNNTQLFIALKHLEPEAKDMESKLDESQSNNQVNEYEFVFNPDLAHLLETVTELGTLKNTQDINMDKATDEVVAELEVWRFQEYGLPMRTWGYRRGLADIIQVSTDRNIQLLYVLMFPCIDSDTDVVLTITEDEQILTECVSTHVHTGEDVVAAKVVNENGTHGIPLLAGHLYDIAVTIKGNNSYFRKNGKTESVVEGVKFSFSGQRSPNGTSVSRGQIPGFKFVKMH